MSGQSGVGVGSQDRIRRSVPPPFMITTFTGLSAWAVAYWSKMKLLGMLKVLWAAAEKSR